MYAIMGVTGRVGGAAATSLLQSGFQVRAILRDAAKAGAWTDRGCEVALAKTEDPAALSAACTDVEGVFVMLPGVSIRNPASPKRGLPFNPSGRPWNERVRPRSYVCQPLARMRRNRIYSINWVGSNRH